MADAKLFSNPVALMVAGISEYVMYTCSCEKEKNISRLYFCRYCTKLRCSECVSHEVDSYFCPNCLENMPSAEAKLKKNRCATCYDCPSCGHTLSLRISSSGSLLPLSTDQKSPVAKKMHYLSCGFCRWTSRDVGLPDQATVSGAWPEPDSSYGKQMTHLVEYFKQISQQDKMEREKKKLSKRKSYTHSHLADKFGLALALSKKRTLSSSSSLASSMLNKGKAGEILPLPAFCETQSEIEPLPEDYYTDIVDLDKVLSIEQRLAHIEKQPEFCKQLYPRHKKLNVRRSQRCRECEHNLSKPEFNPSAIKFKIHLGALQYVPQLKVVSAPPLEAGKEHEVVLSVSNPLEVVVTVSFISMDMTNGEASDATAEIKLPTTTIPVANGDGFSEFEDVESTPDVDDPSVVKARMANKVQFFATVKALTSDPTVRAVFKMVFTHKAPSSTVPHATPAVVKQDGQEETTDISTHEVLVHLAFRCLVESETSQSSDGQAVLSTLV